MTEIGRVRWVLVAGMFLSLGATAWEYPAFAQTSAPAAAGAEPAAAAEAVEPAEPPERAVAATPPAPPPSPPAAPAPAAPADMAVMKSKWAATFYGFLEGDAIWDSTEGLNDAGGIPVLPRPVAYGGATGNHRWTESIRNSRFGFKIAAPEVEGVRVSGQVEVDWLGNAPPTFQQVAGGVSEAAFWNNTGMRVRHVFLKMESDYVDLLFGQTWNLFGWQTTFFPLTVQIQGVPGELFGRTAQFKLSHLFKSDAISVELAAAAVRPPQRDAGVPDGQGGLKLVINNWKGVHTAGGGAGNAVDGLSIGVSGLARQFKVLQFLPAAAGTVPGSNSKMGWGVSVDGMIPVIPATAGHIGNALTLNGSFQTGSGFNDQYTGFTGGVTYPAVPNPGMATPAPTFTPNIDNGLVTYDATGALHTINWTSFLAGFQYYLPPSGSFFISANVSQMKSDNIASFGAAPTAVFTKVQWADGNLFWNVTPALRFGAEYAYYRETFANNDVVKNHRGQFSGFFLF